MTTVNFIFICQVVDEHHPILATTVQWIEAFAKRPEVDSLQVLTLRVGSFSLPENVTVHAIQKKGRLNTLIRFYTTLLNTISQKRPTFFFVHQGGAYPFLLFPVKLFFKIPLYQWKAHAYISPQMKFYARYCDDLIFTCTPHSFPMNLPKRKIVGHGIDVDQFSPIPTGKTGDLITLGRITETKRLDLMFHALYECRQRYGKTYRLDIYGPDKEGNRSYRETLDSLIQELDLSQQVSFKGVVPHEELPKILNRYRALLNFSEGALDKAVIEAMACGIPVLSTNPCVADTLTPELRSLFIVPPEDMTQIGKALNDLLSYSHEQLAEKGEKLREVARQDHSLSRLVEKILLEIGQHLQQGR